MGSRVQRGETASGPLVFWQDSDADLPKCVANDEGEDDCSLTTSDTKTRSLKPGTVCQIESRLIQLNLSSLSRPCSTKWKVKLFCPGKSCSRKPCSDATTSCADRVMEPARAKRHASTFQSQIKSYPGNNAPGPPESQPHSAPSHGPRTIKPKYPGEQP